MRQIFIKNFPYLRWRVLQIRLGDRKQEAFEKCWAHSPLRAVLHCHSPGVATVARRLRIDVHDNDDNDNDNT